MPFCCPRCSKEITSTTSVITVGMRDSCPQCSSDLHACVACEFYDTGSHHECRENQAEYVRDKERGNHCDYFRPSLKGSGPKSSAATAAAALDDLFKK